MIDYLKSCFRWLRNIIRLNLIKTIYFNFRMLPFRKAIKLPIYLYGKISLQSLKGKIIVPGNVSTGMIRIGYRWLDLFPSAFLPTQINVLGELRFAGRCIISGGVALNVQSSTSILQIGDEVTIGAGSFIKSLDIIEIGNRTSISGSCVVMNSNMHYIKNIDTGKIAKPWGKIIIGRGCWINDKSVVTKGAVIPDYSITSRGAFLSKDYSEYGSNCFLVGSPAIAKKTKVQRIFSKDLEKEFGLYFRIDNPYAEFMEREVGLEVDNGKKIEL